MKQFNFIIMVGFMLTGCSSYQEQFDCPPGVGVGCKSLSFVDQLIDQGVLPCSMPLESSTVDNSITDTTSPEIRFVKCGDDDCIDPDGIGRIPEQLMRLWIRGYTDTQGNYHADSTVYTVVRPAQWHVPRILDQHQSIKLQPGA